MNVIAKMVPACALALAIGSATWAAEPTIVDAAKTAEALNGSVEIKSQDGVAFVPVVKVEANVPWRTSPVKIDGDLSDWKSIPPTAVLEGDKFVTWTRGKYAGATDLSTKLWLARDADFLYVTLEADDDKAPPPGNVELAIAPSDSPLITTWRDVGKRYGVDDLHLVFSRGSGGVVKTVWRHNPERMAVEAIKNAFGTEQERAEFISQREDQSNHPRIVSSMVSRTEGGREITSFEVAIPWRVLIPYDPVSYKPLKLGVALHDSDGDSGGVMAWSPGIVGVYSAAHFPTINFEHPAQTSGVQSWAALPNYHYVNQNIDFGFGFYNPTKAEIDGTLTVQSTPSKTGEPLYSAPVKLPPGYSQPKVAIHSEKVGEEKCSFTAKLTLADGKEITIPVHTPSVDDSITIMPLAFIQAKIDQLKKNVAVLEGLYDQVKAKGLDTAYPLAYLSLQKMFIARCEGDLRGGDSKRVLENTAYLEKTFPIYKAYMERILKDPSAQLRVPPRFAPDKLTIKNGYYFDGDRPVFLWGPCLFWYMRGDQHYTWELGFNAAGPELPIENEKAQADIKKYLDAFEANGVLVNASVGGSKFNELRKEHPEVANVDSNNFLPVIIQHPLVRKLVADNIRKEIDFYKQFPAVRTYWLWNEPMYSNYSELTRKDFIEQYVKPHFKTIEEVNKRWGTDFKSFDDVQIQRDRKTSPAGWYDFQQFQGNLFADFFGLLHKTAHETDPTRPTHVKFMAFTLDFFDMERLIALGGINGHDGNQSYRDIPFLDFGRSVFPDKPVVDTEIHLPWSDWATVYRTTWLLALHGLADGNWWCWHSNPRFSNSVGSAENMAAITLSGLDVQRLFDPYVYALNNKPTRIATLFPKPLPGRGGFVNGIRRNWAPAQYSLGIQPRYVPEDKIAGGDLDKYKLLIAGKTGFPLNSTYEGVLKWVKDGGTVIVIGDSFGVDELGRPRDASELIKPNTGEAFTDRSKIYPVGKGHVIMVDDNIPKAAENDLNPLSKLTVVREVIAKAQQSLGLTDDVALDIDPSQSKFSDFDWRSTKVGDGYALLLVPANWWNGDAKWWNENVANTKLKTVRPIKKIVNLITQQEIKPGDFRLDPGVNLFYVELEQ